MQRVGQRDVDQIHMRIGKKFLQFGVRRHTRHVDLLPRRAEIALNTAPVSFEPLWIARIDGSYADSAQPLVGEPVNPSHETNAHNANANHRGASSGVRVARSRLTSWAGRPSPLSWNKSAKRISTAPANAAGTNQILLQACTT